MVKIFNAAIDKKNKSWYVDNILDLTPVSNQVYYDIKGVVIFVNGGRYDNLSGRSQPC